MHSETVLADLAEELGMRLSSAKRLHAEATSEGFVTGHAVELISPDGAKHEHTMYIESKPSSDARDDVVRMRNEETGDVVDVWLYPNDPQLPALKTVVVHEALTIVLGRFGLSREIASVDVVAYRPGKRAVVKVSSPAGDLYVKVIRPAKAEAMHALHRTWLAAGIPVPRSLGWSPKGLLVLEPLPGTPLDTLVPELDPWAVIGIADDARARIARVPSQHGARRSLAARLDWYVDRVREVLPAKRAPFVVDIGREIVSILGQTAKVAKRQTIHGDLHLGQVFVDPNDPRRASGILDIDTAGIGDPADDEAALYGHAVATGLFHEARDRRDAARAWLNVAEFASSNWIRSESEALVRRTRAIAATHLIAHALTGSAEREALVDAARAVLDEKPLMTLSNLRHLASAE